MGRRALPPALTFVAFVADVAGIHTLASLALLSAIPAAFVLMLDCYGDALAARCGAFRPLAAGAGLLLIVVSAALRSPAVVGGVPRLSVSTSALAALLTMLALVSTVKPAVAKAVAPVEAPVAEDERLAA